MNSLQGVFRTFDRGGGGGGGANRDSCEGGGGGQSGGGVEYARKNYF